jgi:hypothetical protein
MPGETVQPSPEPDAGVAPGAGGAKDAAAPPPPDEAASTSGVGSASDQQGSGAPPADAPYDLTDDATQDVGGGEGEQPSQSPSGV